MSSAAHILAAIRGRLSGAVVEPRSAAIAFAIAGATALTCRRAGSRLVIERAESIPLPDSTVEAPDDPPASGISADAGPGSIGGTASDAAPSASSALLARGFGTGPAIVALPREGALVANTALPADDEAEFRSMARLAIARELLSDGLDALSDFQVVGREDGRAEVVLVAAPRASAESAAARLEGRAARVGLRVLGVLALLRAREGSAPVLVVDLSDDAVEFALVANGCLRHSRAAGLLVAAGERPGAAIAELRRCIAAIRMAEGLPAPSEVLVLASREEADVLVPAAASAASCPARRLEAHPSVDLPAGTARETVLARGWPLVGLLLDDPAAVRRDGTAIDLLHPTPNIDVAARSRQRALIVAGIALVGIFAGWTLGARSWRSLEERRDDLAEKARGALPELRRFKRDELLARHLEAHVAIVPDWLAHLDGLRRFAPDPSLVVLDGINAQIGGTEIEYTAKGAFVARPEIRFVLDGEAKDRETADALRDAFVKSKGYTLGSTGADSRGGRRLPNPFAYTLRTPDLVPPSPEAQGPGSGPSSTPRPAGPEARPASVAPSTAQPAAGGAT